MSITGSLPRVSSRKVPSIRWTAWEHFPGKHVESDRLVEHVHHFLALDATVTGKDVALAEERLVRVDIASGRVVAPIGFMRVADGFRAAVMPRRICPARDHSSAELAGRRD